MTTPANRRDDPTLAPELEREVRSLLARLCDELADEQDFRRLGELIEQELAVRRYYLKYIAIHSTLYSTAGSHAETAAPESSILPFPAPAEGIAELDADCSTAAEGAIPVVRRRPIRTRYWLAAAAALMAIGVGTWSLIAEAPTADEALTSAVRAPAAPAPAPAQMPLVAQITHASPDVRWHDANDSYALTSRVRAGQVLALSAGAVELTYGTGTKLLLTGPSSFVVGGNGGALGRGEIVARVTKAGQGFTIVTPHGKIVDRGTEFGVVVDDFGVSEVNVIEGRVEAFPVGVAGPLASRIGLTTGRTLQWSGDAILSMNAATRVARPRLADASMATADAGSSAIFTDLPLDATALDRNQWLALGEIRPAARGVELDASSGAERPYVVTTGEFDPSRGPVTISCDVRLTDIAPQASPAFSILTRAANGRGKPATPWHDMLASGVRCSLKADPASGEGMLDVGAKYEHDRELSAISWRGFARPHADVTYHLEMHDDGLNVSFTATLADNPSVSKTVTCRSLFRGVHNYVALEGFAGGRAVVSNVRVRHYGVDAGDAESRGSALAQESEPVRHQADESGPPVDSLVGDGAELVISEDFDEPALKADKWSTLGDVHLVAGKLQLGVANPDQHIDTWKPRPYLLTAREFEPAARPLTIVGRASFAKNFLHGYGGSFAVLTRAATEYGAGPGWEQSALRRGVRANFWPAALGQNRSLELFEMLSPKPINLLATGDFAINPASRNYVFCITDDGVEATLTFVDATAPHLRQTLAHATKSPDLAAGHIAFEACWGAPVLLDDIRVYEGPIKR